MKKILLLSLTLTFAINAFAQVNVKNNSSYHTTIYSKTNDVDFEQNMLGDEILWSTTFADSSNVSTEDIGGFGDWKWSTTAPGGQWSENSGIIESETPNDGFMLMEADFYNTSPQNGVIDGEVGENAINANFIVGPIDLSSSETEQLVLQFYSYYRICCTPAGQGTNDLNVYIGTPDSTGTTIWADLDFIEGDIYEGNVAKNTLSQIPLGNFSPISEDVYFKFEWIGTHYFWMVDDVSVIKRPANDLKMQSSWLVMENPQYIEYYSIPESQMPDQMLIGAEVYNYGYNDESDVVFEGIIDGTNYGASVTFDSILTDSTSLIETTYFDVSMLGTGTYNFTAQVNSNGVDPSPEDNSLTREFVISEDIYSLDGLYNSSEWIGTGWPYGEETTDGLRFANFFDIKESTVLSSITIDLNTDVHPTSLGTYQTEAGGEIIAYLCDTTGILDPSVTSLDMDLGGILWQSDFLLVNQNHIDWGSFVIDVPEINLNPNAYYVVVEFYSNGLASDILINDDTSVLQPWFASLVYIPGDQTWYSDPNAASIRIGINGNQNQSELNNKSISLFPNPAKNTVEIVSNEFLNKGLEVIIYNMTGRMILNKNYDNETGKITLDLSNINSGNYILELKNNDDIVHKKLVIN